jgi:hypothetical protein
MEMNILYHVYKSPPDIGLILTNSFQEFPQISLSEFRDITLKYTTNTTFRTITYSSCMITFPYLQLVSDY